MCTWPSSISVKCSSVHNKCNTMEFLCKSVGPLTKWHTLNCCLFNAQRVWFLRGRVKSETIDCKVLYSLLAYTLRKKICNFNTWKALGSVLTFDPLSLLDTSVLLFIVRPVVTLLASTVTSAKRHWKPVQVSILCWLCTSQSIARGFMAMAVHFHGWTETEREDWYSQSESQGLQRAQAYWRLWCCLPQPQSSLIRTSLSQWSCPLTPLLRSWGSFIPDNEGS